MRPAKVTMGIATIDEANTTQAIVCTIQICHSSVGLGFPHLPSDMLRKWRICIRMVRLTCLGSGLPSIRLEPHAAESGAGGAKADIAWTFRTALNDPQEALGELVVPLFF
jgi:hypothetical protein